jgi:hypothetical protein
MTDTLKTVLDRGYCMFYHPAVDIGQLTPLQTFEGTCCMVNQQLSINFELLSWPAYLQDEITRLLWVNLFYQRLEIEPIHKPMLVHPHNNQLIIDCGDTRLMTLKLRSSDATVSAVVSCSADQAEKFSNWQPITCDMDLIKFGGFDPDHAKILITASPEGSMHAIDWLEISTVKTVHHFHNVDLRLSMMQKYLLTQTQDFVFTAEWAKTPVNWQEFV